MHIIDNTGLPIEVTDLDGALKQAEMFTTYFHEDKAFAALNEIQKEYWLDVLAKLQQLRNIQQNNVNH